MGGFAGLAVLLVSSSIFGICPFLQTIKDQQIFATVKKRTRERSSGWSWALKQIILPWMCCCSIESPPQGLLTAHKKETTDENGRHEIK